MGNGEGREAFYAQGYVSEEGEDEERVTSGRIWARGGPAQSLESLDSDEGVFW